MLCFRTASFLGSRSIVAPTRFRSFATSYVSSIPNGMDHSTVYSDERHWKLESGKPGEGDAYFSLLKDSEAFCIDFVINKYGIGYCSEFMKVPFFLENFQDTVKELTTGSTEVYFYENELGGGKAVLSSKGMILPADEDEYDVIITPVGMKKFLSLVGEIEDSLKEWESDVRNEALEYVQRSTGGDWGSVIRYEETGSFSALEAIHECWDADIRRDSLIETFGFTEEELKSRPEDCEYEGWPYRWNIGKEPEN